MKIIFEKINGKKKYLDIYSPFAERQSEQRQFDN